MTVDRTFKAVMSAMLVVIVALAAFVGGAAFGRLSTGAPAVPAASASSNLTATVEKVDSIIRSSALAPSSEESITANAIRGMLESLGDPYATYYDTKAYAQLQEDTTGQFGGIGVTFGLTNGKPTIARILPGTPAEKAGVKVDDVIAQVDGSTTASLTVDQISEKIRGPQGTTVAIGLERAGAKSLITVKLVRALISVPNVDSKMIGTDVGYIRLWSFNQRSADDIRKALTDLQGKGAKGFVLDLRENPGGLLTSAVDVASLFVADGVIVRVDERGVPEDVQNATGNLATDKPLVLLVDGNSASASEIVAGALQDYKRAVIVGVKTYGKGSVQTLRPLGDGSAIKLTTAHYLTPLKRVINKKGVTPGIVVTMDAKLQSKPETDTQLTRAIAELRKLTK
jgi:carboxyl-terminal processing protease